MAASRRSNSRDSSNDGDLLTPDDPEVPSDVHEKPENGRNEAETTDEAPATLESANTPSSITGGNDLGPITDTLECCRNVDIYKCLNKISEGTYGSVYRALDTETGEIVALKHIKFHEAHWKEGFPVSYLREIAILLELRHPNILSVKEVVTNERKDQYYMVMEYVEHELKTLLHERKPDFTLSERKCLLNQLLMGVAYIHEHWVLHRDLKTTNILYNNRGVLKICDFGMARKFGQPIKNYTQNVVTHWYRAPELFLGQEKYTEAVDVWSVGCIFAEIISGKPLFTGVNDSDTLDKIFRCCGSPTKENWPDYTKLPLVRDGRFPLTSYKPNFHTYFKNNMGANEGCYMTELGMDLLMKMLTLDPSKRISAKDALDHPYLTTERPRTQTVELMPTIPDTNAKLRRKREPEEQDDEAGRESRFMGRVNPVKFLALMEKARSKQGRH
ncbi:cdc-related protein kinase I, putative [Babesia bigemina]|uniref:Cyclin-dependent kinase 2 homolog n=1 Tax=Babesia bigemina TaxID=5866 RepID=A0A061D8W4_BABBI|nr:cdc-related protein kinase I, putative [Babesia bigemina]CDR95314.1 cdc-related protein kinase I, putative [Babesia bigemina]|eukprot:XP_012767500.1 cdc-related protein kinase I, putative [Babesia bigemina]